MAGFSMAGAHMADDRARVALLQARVDIVAAELFSSPAWTAPVPEVRVDPHVDRRCRALASSPHGHHLIRLSPAVADEPDENLRATLAHEAGHIALGHQRAGRTAWALALCVPLWALAIACGVIAAHEPGRVAGFWLVLAVIAAVLALRMMLIPSRRSELAADRWSSKLIGVDAVLHTLQRLDDECSPLDRLVASLGMDTHPSPAQRVRYLKARQ